MSVVKLFVFLVVVSFGLLGCDYFNPKKDFTLAIPASDNVYRNAANHLKTVLERDGFKLSIIYTKNVREGVTLVANGKADLTMALNHSIYLIDSIGKPASKIRTIIPLFRRFMFVYVPNNSVKNETFVTSTFQNKIIGVDDLNGETIINMELMLARGRADGYRFTTDSTCDVYHTWGTSNLAKHRILIEKGWKRLGLDETWVKFIDSNNPYLHPTIIPSIPSMEDVDEIKTLYTESVLLGSTRLGSNAALLLTSAIYRNRTHLLNLDRMFSSMDERFDKKDMLFPLHAGSEDYLNRDDPSFLERYSDALALLVTLIAFIYGGIQAVRSQISKRQKEQVDKYFTEFLSIKENKSIDKAAQIELYDQLFHKLLLKMTEEKLETSDFHILSRLIQTELTNVNLSGNIGKPVS